MPNLCVISLGCPKNLTDTETMVGILQANGYEIVLDEEDSDVVLLNTCGFIEPAVQESENEVERLIDLKRQGVFNKLVVAGCLTQRARGQFINRYPEVDVVLGVGEQDKIAELLSAGSKKIYNLPAELGYVAKKARLTLPHTAYLKISDGCNHGCSFCTIPQIRGRYRSKKIDDIIEEAKNLADCGAKEVTLVAQDTTSYGLDLYGEHKLSDLLQQLAKIDSLGWIRVMYAYPDAVSTELLEVMAGEKKICRYLDLPIQHIADNVLQSMRRNLSGSEIRQKLELIKKLVPGIALRTSLIVGYPGETEQDFLELINFVKEVEFSKLGVFEYWREKGTLAAGLPEQISEQVKNDRAQQLISVQSETVDRMNQQVIGKTVKVLMDTATFGRSEKEAPEIDGSIRVNSSRVLSPGDFAEVKITRAAGYALEGVLTT